jgi:hypothetical protein
MAEESTAALVRGSLPADVEVLSSDAFRGLEIAFENAAVGLAHNGFKIELAKRLIADTLQKLTMMPGAQS